MTEFLYKIAIKRLQSMFELIWITLLGLLSLLFQLEYIFIPTPWLATLSTVGLVVLWPGFIWQRILNHRTSPNGFGWLPLSFGLGIGWLILPALTIFITESTMRQFKHLVIQLNSLLLLAYLSLIVIRRRLNNKNLQDSEGHNEQITVHPLLELGGLGMLGSILFIFIYSVGATQGGDDWNYLEWIRRFAEGQTATFAHSRWLRDIFYFILGYITYLSGVPIFELYHLYLPAILIVVASFGYLLFAEALFQSRNLAYFAFIIQALYLLSDIHTDSNGEGLAWLARIIEDKHSAWLLFFPLVQYFLVKFLYNGQYRDIFLFNSLAVLSIVIHPVAISWLILSIGSFTLLRLILQPSLKLGLFTVIFLILSIAAFGFGWWIGLERGEQIASESPEYLLALSARRVLFFSVEHDSYIAHPFLLSHPFIILALVLSVGLLVRLRTSLPGQFLLSNTIVVLFLLFNPVLTPLIGRFTEFWQLYRLVWVLPISLTIAYVSYSFIDKYTDFFSHKHPWLAPHQHHIRMFPLATTLILLLVVSTPSLLTSWRSIHQWNSIITSPSAERLAQYIKRELPESSYILAPHNLYLQATVKPMRYTINRASSTVPNGLTANDTFYQSQQIDKALIETLQQQNYDYIIFERTSPLEAQFRLRPNQVRLIYANYEYTLFAWEGLVLNNAMLMGHTHLKQGALDEAEASYQDALKYEPDHPLGIIGLATIDKQRQNIESAIQRYETALIHNPTQLDLNLKLAQAYAQVTTAENLTRFVEHVEKTLALPTLQHVGGYDQLVQAYRILPVAVQQLPNIQTIKRSILDFYQQRAETAPRYYPYHQKVAEVYQQLGDTPAAIAHYETVAQQFPGRIDPYLKIAQIHTQQGAFEQAVAAYQDAIRSHTSPAPVYPYLELARFYRFKQIPSNPQAALKTLAQAEQLAYTKADQAAIAIEQAHNYTALGDVTAAEAAFQKGVDNAPQQAWYQYYLGQHYERQANWGQAVIYLQRAVELDQHNAEFNVIFAKALFELGRNDEAYPYLQIALNNPNASRYASEQAELLGDQFGTGTAVE